MRLRIVTPAPAGSLRGNRVTALRWARLLRELGHRASVATGWDGERCDVLVAIHARKSHDAMRAFREARPHAPILLLLAGTDIYADLPRGNAKVARSLEWATRLVVLQPMALRVLPRALRSRTRVVIQSAQPPRRRPRRRGDVIEACVVGHLRAVKDPLLPARAVRRLPETSRIRILHVGSAMAPAQGRAARREQRSNPRWRWLGELSHAATLRLIARSRLLILPSRAEGGASVISEALACGVPVLASDADGNVGLLGRDYPGLFQVGDAAALARLLDRFETDAAFRRQLTRICRRLAKGVRPQAEKSSLRNLLRELARR